jgi:Lysine-specific metallo-endopeptidase
MPFTYARWIELSNKGRWLINRGRRSEALRDVDKWFKAYEDTRYTNKQYLRNLSQSFRVWSDTKQTEEMKGGMAVTTLTTVRNKAKDDASGLGAVELLRNFITQQNLADVVIKEEATGLEERVAVVENPAALMTVGEMRKVTEAIKILQDAIRNGRDTVIGAAKAGSNQTLYVKWFGAYDVARCKTVRDNFMILDNICSNKGIVFNDGRGDATMNTAFAWAYRGHVQDFPNMWLGIPFFTTNIGPARARKGFSDTLGTMVHEMTHACFYTADVPINAGAAVDASGHPINPAHEPVCNDPKNDCRLAETRPADAIRNADNYGEFVVDVYSGLEFNYVWP